MTTSESDRALNARAVAAHRARTGNAYQKKYNKAVRIANQALRDRHPDEYAGLLDSARRVVGL